MTYSDKLKNPKWQAFRKFVFNNRGDSCETCGSEDKPMGEVMHVHHVRYILDREPWEYDIDDVRVYCGECHAEIHRCEESWRNFIRSLPSHNITEFQSLVDELVKLDPHTAEGVASYAKNDARGRRHSDRPAGEPRQASELVLEWARDLVLKLEGSK